QDTLGWVLYRLQRFGDALPPLCRAAKLDPGSPEIHSHLGDAFWRVGLSEDARMQWQQAYDLADRRQLLSLEGEDFLHAEGQSSFKSKMRLRLASGPPDSPGSARLDHGALEKAVNGDCDFLSNRALAFTFQIARYATHRSRPPSAREGHVAAGA